MDVPAHVTIHAPVYVLAHVPVYAPAGVRVCGMGCPASVAMVSRRVAGNAPAAVMRRCMAAAMPAAMMRSRMAAVMSGTMSAVAATSGDRHSRDHEQRGNCGND